MTRSARRGPENKKKHEASDWNTLKLEALGSKPNPQHGNRNGKHGGSWKKGNGKTWKKNLTAEERLLHTVLNKEQRRERRRQKREKNRIAQKVCFKCRLPGHKLEDCIMNDSSQGTGICYKCGSTEHKSSVCKAKVPQGEMPFASCHVCGKQGHLARSCPDNPRGLYPRGGGCRTCGSVEHFQRDCAEYLAKQGIGSKTMKTINMATSLDDLDDDDDDEQIANDDKTEQQKKPEKKKTKVIRF